MQSRVALQNAKEFVLSTVQKTKKSPIVFESAVHENVMLFSEKIKKELQLDYSQKINLREGEKEKLEKLFVSYLSGKDCNFNSHYIRLLAWYLQDLKIIKQKSGNSISVFEYAPNILFPYTNVEKTFTLFKKKIPAQKVSFALLQNYLNNYGISSARYRRELFTYLKNAKCSRDTIFCFNSKMVKAKLLPQKNAQGAEYNVTQTLLNLRLPNRLLSTAYFCDVWFFWIFNNADLRSEKVLSQVDCIFFKGSSQEKQKLLLAKIISTAPKIDGKRTTVEYICSRYVFPNVTSGNIFEKAFWETKTDAYKSYFETAWNLLEECFIKTGSYKTYIKEKV